MTTNYDAIVNRTHPSRAARQIPETVANEIIAESVEQSTALQLGNVMRMPSFQHRIPVLKAFASAYWLNGDASDTRKGAGTGSQADKDSAVKSRTNVEWDNVYLTPEELAVLIPVPDAWMDDSSITWEELQREVTRAFAEAIDAAVLFGGATPSGLPVTFGKGLVPEAIEKDKVVHYGDGTPESNSDHRDLALDIATIGEELDKDGYVLNGFASGPGMRWRLRKLRDQEGQPLLTSRDGQQFLYEEPLSEVRNGAWDGDQAQLLAGDWSKLIIGIRQDITFKVFDQAVLSDPATGEVVYNAVEQDGKVLRAVMRLGYVVPNPIKKLGGTFPFYVLADEES